MDEAGAKAPARRKRRGKEEQMNEAILFETERMTFRRFTEQDRAAAEVFLKDPEVMYAYPHTFTKEDVENRLARQQQRYRQDGLGLWAVVLRSTGEMVGQAGLTWQDCEGQPVLEVGYLLKNTVSERGTVSRGVCRVEDGRLLGIKETLKIRLEPDGTIADEAEGVLPADAVVSMNFWGFAPSFFRELEMFFYDFLRYEAGDNIKAECMLPSLVGKLIGEGKLKVSVLQSADRWFGMTYHEDRQAVAEELKRLHACGVYPETLRL